MINEGLRKADPNKALNNTMLIGLLLRLLFLTFLLTVGTMFSEPYFISDDIKYETQARIYLQQANGLFDINLLKNLLRGYAQPFWTVAMCLSAYLLRTIYAGRVINVFLSALCIRVIYNLTFLVSNYNEKAAIKAARLFAYLPLSIFTCCFPIKDIFIMFGFFYAFYIFVSLQKGEHLSLGQMILCIGLLFGIFFSRGAVVEFLAFCGVAFYILRLLQRKKYIPATLFLLTFLGVAFIFRNSILEPFSTKLDHYGEKDSLGNGIQFLQISSIGEIYKLPFTYFYATLQPLALNIFSTGYGSFWWNIATYANISMYPIAIGNFLYIFHKKQNLFFWLSTLAIYSAVIILSLGVFRHYLFLLPVQMINYSIYAEERPKDKTLIFFAFPALLILLLLYSFIRLS